MEYEFTSESVSIGHPDKVADLISDAVATFLLSKNISHRAAIETLVTTNMVTIAGEYKSNNFDKDEIEKIIRNVVAKIGYEQEGFHHEHLNIYNELHGQSPDIALGTDNFGAGDQGLMFGYACNETEELMPAPIHYSHKILRLMAEDRKSGILKNIEPDNKSQITFEYINGKPTKVKSVVISSQHSPDISQSQVRDLLRPYMIKSIPKKFLENFDDSELYVNPTGNFVIGGPDGDTGLTGRKIIVDTYGGAAPHGGGAFSGKDPTKVDRSAAYAARYIAKNVVASKIADKCLIQLAYAIGVSKPLSIYVDLFDGDEEKSKHVEKLINDNFDLSPRGIREMLNLNKAIYEKTAAYGHFGRSPEENGSFSWEKTDKKSVFSK